MTIPTLASRPSRQHRSLETARLMSEAAAAVDPERRRHLLHQVVVLNLSVAQAVARRFGGRQIPLEDLEQVAYLALVRAAEKFDVGQERDFLSFAVPTMSGEIKRHFRDLGWTIRPPRRIQEIQSKVIHAYRSCQETGTPPSPARIADQLDLPEADVTEALRADGCFTPASLDRTVTDASGERTLLDCLVAENTEEDAREARLLLAPVLRRLTPRERRILHLRFVEEMTQREIGAEIGVTQMQTSRLLAEILGKLRRQLGELDLTA